MKVTTKTVKTVKHQKMTEETIGWDIVDVMEDSSLGKLSEHIGKQIHKYGPSAKITTKQHYEGDTEIFLTFKRPETPEERELRLTEDRKQKALRLNKQKAIRDHELAELKRLKEKYD